MLDFGSTAKLELEVVAYSSVTSKVLMVGLTKEGLIKFDVSHTGDGTEDILTFRIPDIPILLNLFTDDATIERGEYFASVYLKINGERVGKLCSGYISKQSGISYPITHDQSEVGNQGALEIYLLSIPSAGADVDRDINTNVRWKIISLVAELTTDGNAANRRVHLLLAPSGFTFERSIEIFSSVDQPENTSYKYTFAAFGAIPSAFDDDKVSVGIPSNILIGLSGGIATVTKNIQVGDQWSNIFLYVEEFIED